MNTRDIEYYVQIVKQKNFTKVAKYFQVSQPTITYALKRLEKELDAVLITRDRSHHELVITPAGKQLFIHAQSILQEIKMAKAEITQLQKKKLRFGMPPIIGNEFVSTQSFMSSRCVRLQCRSSASKSSCRVSGFRNFRFCPVPNASSAETTMHPVPS